VHKYYTIICLFWLFPAAIYLQVSLKLLHLHKQKTNSAIFILSVLLFASAIYDNSFLPLGKGPIFLILKKINLVCILYLMVAYMCFRETINYYILLANEKCFFEWTQIVFCSNTKG